MDERIERGMRTQLDRWRSALDRGAQRVGWKVGLNPPPIMEALGIDRPVVGYMVSETVVDAGGSVSLAGTTRPGAEPELAIHVGEDGGVGRLGAALEVVDIDQPLDDLEAILAADVFHAAVAFGPPAGARDLAGLTARITRDGEPVDEVDLAATVGDPAAVLAQVGGRLEEAGEGLAPGDVVIAGSLIQALPVKPGEDVALDLGPLGSVSLHFA
jgi:2-oxo-hept-3-ene-1,7-dioate hydratase